MFVVLQTEARAESFFQRLKEQVYPQEPELTKIAVRNGAPFFVLKVKKKKTGVQWDDVAFAAGRCASHIVASEDEEIPENGIVRRFLPKYLPFMMLLSTAINALKICEVPHTDISIGIMDKLGALANIADKAADAASVVKVVTERERVYERVSDELMENHGASLIYGSQAEMLRDCNVIICREREEAGSSNAAIFSVSDGGIIHGSEKSFAAGRFEMPKEYEGILPKGVNPITFASALHELCGVRGFEDMPYKTLVCGGVELSVYGVARKLSEFLSV